jgi:hypothetical protein
VVDIVAVLSDSKNPAVYWRVLKKRLLDEGSDETVTKCNGLKMPAADGKMRVTDMADTETMLRIVQRVGWAGSWTFAAVCESPRSCPRCEDGLALDELRGQNLELGQTTPKLKNLPTLRTFRHWSF